MFWRLVKILCWSTATCSMKLNLTRISYPEAVQAQFMPFSGSAIIYVERKSGCQSCQGAWFLAPVPCDCLIGKHFGQRAGKRKRCKVCAYTKNAKGNLKHTKTNLYCANCDAHLCEQPCFQKMALPIQPLIGLPASLLAKDHKQWPSNAEQQCFHAFFSRENTVRVV